METNRKKLQVVAPDGQPIGEKTYKRDHDPERVAKQRMMLSNTLAELKKAWAADMSVDPQGATQPDVAAIKAHYLQRWTEQCRVTANASEPVVVDFDAMGAWIDAQVESTAIKRRLVTPVQDLDNLEEFGYAFAGTYDGGDVWASTECVLHITKQGQCSVYLRGQRERVDVFLGTVYNALRQGNSDVLATDYTMNEVAGMLKSMRRERNVPPTEAQLMELVNALGL